MADSNGHAKGPANGSHNSATQPSKFELVRFNDIRLTTRRQYLIRGLLPREGLALIWGPPGCGKSFLAFDMAMHTAMGWPYRGRRAAKGPVIYVAFEGENGLDARSNAYAQDRFQTNLDEPVDFWLVRTKIRLPDMADYIVSEIERQVEGVIPSAVYLDTLNRSFIGSENKDDDMGKYIAAADHIYSTFKCCVVIIHHSGVAGDRYRGHTSLKGAVDAEIEVSKDKEGLITAKVIKMKDGKDNDQFQSRLRVVDLGDDEDGETITSCVVDAADGEVPLDDEPLSDRERDCLRALEDTLSFASQPAPNGHASLRAVSLETWRKQAYLCSAIDENKSGHRARWYEVRQSLIAKRKISIENNLVWIVP